MTGYEGCLLLGLRNGVPEGGRCTSLIMKRDSRFADSGDGRRWGVDGVTILSVKMGGAGEGECLSDSGLGSKPVAKILERTSADVGEREPSSLRFEVAVLLPLTSCALFELGGP